MTARRPVIKPLNPNPVQQAAAFSPPPTGIVTVNEMGHSTLKYWKTIRIAWLSGYKINWVIPGREGAVSGSKSVYNLDARIQPVEEIFPERTARYQLDPYVLVYGRPHEEPPLGTRVTLRATARSVVTDARSPDAREAPQGLGETARWLPDPSLFDGRIWRPVSTPIPPDGNIAWEGSEANAPIIDQEFQYARRGRWVNTPSMSMQESTYLRLNGMPLYNQLVPLPPITLIFVAAISSPVQYWGSLIRAVEPDGSSDIAKTNLDFRLMPDGNIHPFTWGWQYPLPLVGTNHTLSLFGFTLDTANNFVRMFTIDRTLRFSEMRIPTPHSSTSSFVLGRSAEALLDMDVLDVLMYRGLMTVNKTIAICNELDAAYGITAAISQEQG